MLARRANLLDQISHLFAKPAQDARAGLARLLKDYRDLTVSKVLSALVYSQPTLDRIAEGLRKAGFPEE